MKSMPQALFVVDPRKERNAIAEARKLHIPIVGIVDTNCDPDEIDYVIPANDDAIRAVKLLTGKMADAVLEGQQGVSNEEVAAEQNIDLNEDEKLKQKKLKKKLLLNQTKNNSERRRDRNSIFKIFRCPPPAKLTRIESSLKQACFLFG